MPEIQELFGNNTPVERHQSDSVAARQLSSPPPRRAVLKRGYWKWWLTTLSLLLSVLVLRDLWPEISKLLFGITAISLLASSLGPSRRKSKLFVTRGLVARGIVVSKTSTGVDNSIFEYDYSVAYDSSAGSHTLHYSGGNDESVGDSLTVLYLPERPEKAMLYRDCLHEAVQN